MLKRRIDHRPKLRPEYMKQREVIYQLKECNGCKDYKEMRARNKSLNNLVLSLS